MTYMLDSNAVTLVTARPSTGVARKFANALPQGVCMSAIVAFEAHYGFALNTRRNEHEQRFAALLRRGVSIVPFDEDDALTAGTLAAALRASGTNMGAYDLLIAAQALRVGSTLVTSDAGFARVDGLKTEDWSKT